MKETLAERFARLVDAAGLSNRDVAHVMGVSEAAVYKIRRGDSKELSLRSALRLARRLGVSPYYLAGETEPRKNADGSMQPEDASETGEPLGEKVDRLATDFRAMDHDLKALAEELGRIRGLLEANAHPAQQRAG